MRRTRAAVAGLVLGVAVIVAGTTPVEAQRCQGDCNNDGEVTINELIMGVNIALSRMRTMMCNALDRNRDDRVSVDELIGGVRSALDGCPINLSAKTFRSVQQVFAQSCAFTTCHSPIGRQGGLVLSSEQLSWSSLVDVEPQHPEAKAMGLMRVASGDPEKSFLLRKLRGLGPGDPMPQAGGLLSEEIISVIEAWIERGAHETLEECEALGEETAFEGGGAHAGDVQTVCDAEPIEVGDFEWEPEPPLPVPASNEGIQLYVPPHPVAAGSEWELCWAFRIDWEKVRDDMGVAGLPAIAWQEYRMHEGSHHLLLYSYFGENTEWNWPEGPFKCSAGNCVNPGICRDDVCISGRVGQSCSNNAQCSECPPDGRQILPIGGTQVAGTRYQTFYPEGVGIPVLNPRAVIIANLHYNNPFQPAQEIYSEAWLNLYFHKPGQFKAILDGIFAIGFNDLVVEPYERRVMDTIWRPRGLISGESDAAVFQLFGHMHKRGVRFQIDLVSGGTCSASGALCTRDSDCRCRPAQRNNCTPGQTCILGPNWEDTTIYRTNSWDNSPVVDYPKPYLMVPKEAGLRWTCEHVNGIEGDEDRPPKRCHDGCTVCGWDPETRTCRFTRGSQLGFHESTRVYQEGEPMPLAFGELADDDMCNMFGYFIPANLLDRLP